MMIGNMYRVNNSIMDQEGNEWVITQVWDYENYLCMTMIGRSIRVAAQLGGIRIPYREPQYES